MADPHPAPPPSAPRGGAGLRLFLRPYVAPLTAGVLAVFAASACYMAVPLVIRGAIRTLESRGADTASHEAVRSALLSSAGLLLALAFARALFNYAMRWTIFGASRSIERDLRNALFAHLQTLSAGYYDRTRSGDLLSRAINDVEGIRMMIGMGFFQGANTLSMALFCVGGMLWIHPKLTGLALLPMLAAALAMRPLGALLHRLSTDVQEQLSALSNRAQENFSGARVVRAYAQEAHEEAAFDALNRDNLDKNVRLARAQGAVNAALAILGEAGVAVLIGVGGPGIVEGTFSLGDFLAFTAYQFMLVWPMIATGWMLNLVQRGLACWDRVAEVLRERSEVEAAAGPRTAPDGAPPAPPSSLPATSAEGAPEGQRGAEAAAAPPPRLEFDRLTFAYPGGPEVLRDVTFTVEPGQRFALVGRTGAGKSTIAHLLARFYPVPRGMIRLDGRDLNDIPVPELRARLGYVPQETFLFSEAIRENIRFGNPGAPDEAVLWAARVAHLLPDIQDFPERLGQPVGERGVTLSGGQKQRTALARVIAKDPRLVVLDDPFASVDTQTESAIRAELHPFLRGRTSLLIAHRIATVRDADRIAVLDDGRLVEQGAHAELLRGGGLYAALAARQAMEETLAGTR